MWTSLFGIPWRFEEIERNFGVNTSLTWKHLVGKPKSIYKQLFVRERWIAARTLYGQTLGDDARSPEEVAKDYGLPLEVVMEAITYCESNPPEIREDWERDEALNDSKRTDRFENGFADESLGLQDIVRVDR